MAILITGGTGFLGSHLARYLVTEQRLDGVVLFDRHPARERIHDLGDRVTVLSGDILDSTSLVAAIEAYGIDRVAHFAFMAGTAHPEQIVPYTQMTCVGTATVFEAARLCGIKRVINASSMAVYGPPRGVELREDDPARPAILYASCKLWTEQLAEIYNRQHDMEILSLRVCATMGLGRLRRASLDAGLMSAETPHFMAAPELALLEHHVTLPPDEQLTEFVYAADVAHAWWLALTVDRPAHSVFNLTAARHRVGELTRLLREEVPDAEISVAETPLQPGPLLNNERLIAELGFTPSYTLASGLAAYVEAVRARERAAQS